MIDSNGTGEITVGAATLLFWDKMKKTKYIPHHPDLGIPIMSVNDGYTKSMAYLHTAKLKLFNEKVPDPLRMHTSTVLNDINGKEHVIPLDDEESQITSLPSTKSDAIRVDELDLQHFNSNHDDRHFYESETNTVCSNDDSSIGYSDDETFKSVTVPQNKIDELISSVHEKTSRRQKELLHYHYKLKHLPFSVLKRLASRGIIPKYLADVPPPLCYGCQLGHQHRKPWRGKGKLRKHIRRQDETFPGANTSTDQMISQYGGLIPQVRGKLMKAKYYGATVFVDHFSDFTYVHLMQDMTGERTLEAKNAYERLMKSYGHTARAYHADNGRFAEDIFVQDSKDKAQKVTYCGVGSHHQYGISERRIRTLGEDARTMLAHGQHLWPEVINKSL